MNWKEEIKIAKKWKSPAKQIPKAEKGKCPYCKRYVKNILAHCKVKHKVELQRKELKKFKTQKSI